MEKTVQKIPLADEGKSDREYWKAQTPEARIEAVTLLVNQYYGVDDELPPRFQRLLTVTRRPLR